MLLKIKTIISFFKDSTTKQPNMSSEAKTTTDSGTDKLMSTSAISLSNDAENNNISPTNAATQNIISSSNNTPGNRHSMIAGMQKYYFLEGNCLYNNQALNVILQLLVEEN